MLTCAVVHVPDEGLQTAGWPLLLIVPVGFICGGLLGTGRGVFASGVCAASPLETSVTNGQETPAPASVQKLEGVFFLAV